MNYPEISNILLALVGALATITMAFCRTPRAKLISGIIFIVLIAVLAYLSIVPRLSHTVSLCIQVWETSQEAGGKKVLKGPISDVQVGLEDRTSYGGAELSAKELSDANGVATVERVKMNIPYEIKARKRQYELLAVDPPIVVVQGKDLQKSVEMRKIEDAIVLRNAQGEVELPKATSGHAVNVHWNSASLASLSTSYLKRDSLINELVLKNDTESNIAFDLHNVVFNGLDKNGHSIVRAVFDWESTNALKGSWQPSSIFLPPGKQTSLKAAFSVPNRAELPLVESFSIEGYYKLPSGKIEKLPILSAKFEWKN